MKFIPIPIRLEMHSIPEPNSGCFIWLGNTKGGYGRMTVNRENITVTHVALEQAGKPRPPGAFACHTCDNTYCINPDHLYWGNAKTNLHDAIKRGRHPGHPPRRRGSAQTLAKLNEATVLEMRKAHKSGMTMAQVGRVFGIKSSGQVHRILTGTAWSHVPMPLADGCSS